jgi:16S rRNA (cytosine1402-N4)-methyltransferase
MDKHIPVLLDEVIDLLNLHSGDKVVDCTLGNGGHSKRILEETAPDGRVLGIDADSSSIERAKQNLNNYLDRIIFHQGNFQDLSEIVQQYNFSNPFGILMDLGWSTSQLEEGKGFSFQYDEELLDMRYGDEGKTAADLVNGLPEQKLAFIFRRFGEEKFAREIAEKLVKKRTKNEINTVGDLKKIVLQVYRGQLNTDKEVPRLGNIHPATKVWQALRIATNNEIKVLKKTLPQALEVLKEGGRLAVISFHSLEDRAVKHFFKGNQDKLRIITSKPITATDEEIEQNPSARSAKLRVAEKLTK